MKITWFDEAWDDYVWWQTQDRKILKRINQLLEDSKRNGYGGIGKPEPLKGEFRGFWSKRIDEVHRLVYRIKDGFIEVVSCKGHYDE
jgi:toxin YoeB